MSERKGVRALAAGVTVAMVIAVALGLWAMGPPSHQRALRLDSARVGQIYSLHSMVVLRYATKKTMPSTLAEVDPNSVDWLDPVSGQPFEYSVTGPESFRLCATFDAASEDTDRSGLYVFPRGAEWKHPAGRFCFDRPVKPATE
ncbi:hypothetical protein [Pinirhizobacter soli]|uniref:hypothetical protein n=1 Tax=Pinirhizobacter soli TaxID=2786953 RepID=UPI002029B9FD|nr:hypothetical protein [Pinirhizobacter soli]